MNVRRKISLGIAVALGAASLVSATPAFALGKITSNGDCGDLLALRVQNTGDPIRGTITIPSIDSTEVWSLTVTQQDYGAATGGRIGDPVDITSSFTPLVFNPAEGGFSTAGVGEVTNTENLTHGISYTATRAADGKVCTNTNGFWTNPAGADEGPVSGNPTTRPDAAPLFAGESEADAGTNDVLLLMDQEMLDNGQGIPATNRFTVRFNGAAQTVTNVQVVDDSPPNQAVVDLTTAAPVPSTGTVTAQYIRPLTAGSPALQDLEGLRTASFGPVNVSVVGGAAPARAGAAHGGPLMQRIGR